MSEHISLLLGLCPLVRLFSPALSSLIRVALLMSMFLGVCLDLSANLAKGRFIGPSFTLRWLERCYRFHSISWRNDGPTAGWSIPTFQSFLSERAGFHPQLPSIIPHGSSLASSFVSSLLGLKFWWRLRYGILQSMYSGGLSLGGGVSITLCCPQAWTLARLSRPSWSSWRSSYPDQAQMGRWTGGVTPFM